MNPQGVRGEGLEQRCPTKMFLSPQKWRQSFVVATIEKYMQQKLQLRLLTISKLLEKVPVATCGEWRQGWTTLFYLKSTNSSTLYGIN
jgi:hypothetical protein